MPGTSGPDHMFPDRETTQYQVAIPDDDWEAWKRSVPRTVPLYRRIHTLLQLDTDRDEEDDLNERLISLQFQRIVQRGQNIRDALDDGDQDRALEEVAKIEEIAGPIAE
jgi:hypothetical protein